MRLRPSPVAAAIAQRRAEPERHAGVASTKRSMSATGRGPTAPSVSTGGHAGREPPPYWLESGRRRRRACMAELERRPVEDSSPFTCVIGGHGDSERRLAAGRASRGTLGPGAAGLDRDAGTRRRPGGELQDKVAGDAEGPPLTVPRRRAPGSCASLRARPSGGVARNAVSRRPVQRAVELEHARAPAAALDATRPPPLLPRVALSQRRASAFDSSAPHLRLPASGWRRHRARCARSAGRAVRPAAPPARRRPADRSGPPSSPGAPRRPARLASGSISGIGEPGHPSPLLRRRIARRPDGFRPRRGTGSTRQAARSSSRAHGRSRCLAGRSPASSSHRPAISRRAAVSAISAVGPRR